ncbi:uncharacterized protein [Arachis hypogaea]|uniref:uncharacterized protein n=1 Tax=Arachis hypogaea TaxID=3818 RepID=UPI003B20BE0E
MDGQSERTIQTLEDMLRACVLDQPRSWDRYMPLVEFAYNNSFHASIGMASYEALYGRKCQSPFCWYESGEASVLGPDLYTTNEAHVLEPELVELRENLTFQVTPVRIDDTSVKKLHGKEVQLVKVSWKQVGVEENTWELESKMQKDYPELFSGTLESLITFGFGLQNCWVSLIIVFLEAFGIELKLVGVDWWLEL